jgi:hypothetical protein
MKSLGVNLASEPKTISVPEAGRIYYDLSRNGSYEAARRGEIPTIRVGRLLRVPVAAMERKLEQLSDKQRPD